MKRHFALQNLSSKGLLVAAGGLLLFSAVAAAQSTKSKTAAPADAGRARSESSIKSVDDRVRIEPFSGPPIYLEEKKVMVPPSVVGRDSDVDRYADGKIRAERQKAKYSDDHYEADGYYREFYPGGKKFVEGQYRQGRREGDWTYWFDNGQINRMVSFKNGQLDGQWEVYRADGTLAAKQSFAAGLRDGTWVIYNETGKQPLREENYADKGKVDGVWKLWYPNGQLQQQAGFKLGQRHGALIQWKEDGSKVSESNWVNGKLDGTATIWLADGGKTVQQFKNGLLVSEKKE
jgi:antitoxin component YwqK of YwqJK toxin-antitoxin module